jgi:hypothetical protein
MCGLPRYFQVVLAILLLSISLPYAPVASGTDTCISSFGAEESWTSNPYFGTHGTFFADVTGDGRADAIVINAINDGLITYLRITVRRSDGAGFKPNETWLQELWPNGTSFFADVTGDGRADWILVKPTKVVVRRSNVRCHIYLPLVRR